MIKFRAILTAQTKSTISQRVREALQARGLGYNEIERMTDGRLTHSFISRLVSGASANPRLDKLVELAAVLGTDVGALVDVAEEPEGWRESRFYEMYDLYRRLERPMDRRYVEDDLRVLMEVIKSFPKKAKKESPRYQAEARRKSKITR